MPRPSRKTLTPKSPALAELLEGMPAGKAIPERKFQGIMDQYNIRNENREEGLSGVKLYIYRTFPRIDNTLTGRKNSNIEQFECVKTALGPGEQLTEVQELPADIRGYVTQRHGGGRYRVSLNDKGNEHEQVVQTALKIDEIEYPPILDPRELVSTDPETLGWITRQISIGVLAKLPDGGFTMANDQSAPRASTPGADAAGMSAVAIEAIRSARDPIAEHGAKKTIDMMADTFRSMQPAAVDPVAQFTAMAQVLKPGGDSTGMTAMCTLLSTMMVESNKTTMFLMQQMLEQKRGPVRTSDDDGVDKMERLLEIAGKFGGPKASGGGFMDMLKEWAPMLLPLILTGMGKVSPQQAAQTIASLQPPAPANTPAPAEMPAPGGGALTAQQAEEFAMRAAGAMQRGHSGDDFALGLEVIFNPQTYDMVRQLGRDNIIAFLLQSQQAAFFQSAGQQTNTFIEAFLQYGEPEPTAPAPGNAPASAIPLATAPAASAPQ